MLKRGGEKRNAPALARTVPSPCRITTVEGKGVKICGMGLGGCGMSRSWPGRELCLKKKRRGVLPWLLSLHLHPGRTMPSRGLRPSLVRTHSRSSSGGSSKVVYNLQLTHKDPMVQSKIDKARRTGHTFEVRHCSPTITPLHLSERCSQNVVHATSIFFWFFLRIISESCVY